MGGSMRLKQGQIWRCQNDACGAEILVTETGGLEDGGSPRCSCGSIMKMPYTAPKMRSYVASEELRRLLDQLSVVLR